MPVIEIPSLPFPPADMFFQLTDAQLRSRQEPEKGLLITEGPRVTRTALERGLTPVALLMRKKMIGAEGADLTARCADIPVFTADDETLSALTGFKLQRSWVLGAFHRPPEKTVREAIAGARRVAVLEGINEPSNVGAIFRSAAALGADAVLLTPDCCDVWHRRSVRVCMGAAFFVPWARTDEKRGFPELREAGFRTVGLALRDSSLELDDPKLRASDRLAVYLGTEDSGLREETVRQCDDVVKIPMARGIDSLNVAACAAVAFWALRPSQGGLASPLRDPPADFPFAPSVLPDGKSAR